MLWYRGEIDFRKVFFLLETLGNSQLKQKQAVKSIKFHEEWPDSKCLKKDFGKKFYSSWEQWQQQSKILSFNVLVYKQGYSKITFH